MPKPDEPTTVQPRSGGNSRGGQIALISSVVLFLASAAALGGAWAISSGVLSSGANENAKDGVMEAAIARAEQARSQDELVFLNSLAEAGPASSAATNDAAARLHFTAANGLYDGGFLTPSTTAIQQGAARYKAAGREESTGIAEVWLQLKDKIKQSKTLPPTEELSTWVAAKALAEKLTLLDSENIQFLRLSSLTSLRAGEAARRASDLVSAETHSASALEISRKIADARPLQPTIQRDLWTALISKGDIALQLSKTPDALALYNEALERAEASSRNDPSGQGPRDTYTSQLKLADAKAKAADVPGAIASYQAALDAGQSMYAKSQATTDQRYILQAQLRLAGLKRSAKDLDGAADLFRQAIDTATAVASTDTKNVAFARDLARAYWGLASINLDMKDVPSALTNLRASAELRANLISLDASNISDLRDAAANYERLATLSKDSSSWKSASRYAEQLTQHASATDADRQMLSRIKAASAKS